MKSALNIKTFGALLFILVIMTGVAHVHQVTHYYLEKDNPSHHSKTCSYCNTLKNLTCEETHIQEDERYELQLIGAASCWIYLLPPEKREGGQTQIRSPPAL